MQYLYVKLNKNVSLLLKRLPCFFVEKKRSKKTKKKESGGNMFRSVNF